MRVLITGARGFIGRHVRELLESDPRVAETHAVRSSPGQAEASEAQTVWHTVDLTAAEAAHSLVETVRPTHIVNAAWVTKHSDYWESEDNIRWLAASCDLLHAFQMIGGERFVQIGTAAEYDWSYGCMVEGVTPERPTTLYGAAKKSFHDTLQMAALKSGFSAATGRIFFGYGAHENPARIIPYACQQIARGEAADFSSGSAWRDFLHVEDLAAAVVALLFSPLQGAVNLASGIPVQLAEIVTRLGEIAQRPDLIRLGVRPDRPGDPPMLVADVSRIVSTGWKPKRNLAGGLSHTYRWWRGRGEV